MSTFSVLIFDPVLPVNATGDNLIDRLQLPDSLLSSEISPESFVALLKAWTIATSTSGPTDATGTDSPGDGSTPLQAARTTRLSASSTATSAVDTEAAGEDRNPLSRAIAPGRVAFPLARRVPHRWIAVPPDILEQSFVALLNAWTLAASTSGLTDATGADSPGDVSTPFQTARTSRASASSTY
jgi:hypothetical protein